MGGILTTVQGSSPKRTGDSVPCGADFESRLQALETQALLTQDMAPPML